MPTPGPGASRDGKTEIRIVLEQMLNNGSLARTRRCGKDDGFALKDRGIDGGNTLV
jgi:hypothetical protein